MSQIVITGDLFDNPTKNDALAFNDFRNDLESYIGKEVIVIPGNHDQRILGNSLYSFGTNLQQLANLSWGDVIFADDIESVFLCFDSARHGNFAKGIITREQRLHVATEFDQSAISNPNFEIINVSH